MRVELTERFSEQMQVSSAVSDVMSVVVTSLGVLFSWSLAVCSSLEVLHAAAQLFPKAFPLQSYEHPLSLSFPH